MYSRKWTKIILTHATEFIWKVTNSKSRIIVVDTETTGLNIVHDNPFVLTMTYVDDAGNALAYAYDLSVHSKQENDLLISSIYQLTENGLLICHNIVYDLHMLANAYKPIYHENVLDTQILIRLGTDAITVKEGGAPLKLKDYAKRYIDPDAAKYAKILDIERGKIAKHHKQNLLNTLKNRKKVMDILDHFPNDIDDLPLDEQNSYRKWLNDLPEKIRMNMRGNFPTTEDIPFDMIPRDLLMTYAQHDAILTYEIYETLYPIVIKRGQEAILKKEQALIIPLFEMTRQGFRINKPYVIEAKKRLKAYIIERQQHLIQLAERPLTANQNKEILILLHTKFNLPDVPDTKEETLSELAYNLEQRNENKEAMTFISIILELRTLSKWYTTYLMRIYNEMQRYDYIYTSLNQSGAVTGRFTSDFQQFPKDAIKDYNGNELLHPRKMFITNDNEYLFYLDYSQIELRIQAIYTILIGSPDLNLCRAYMPYLCHHYRTGVKYDYNNQTHIDNWDRKQPGGTASVWLKDEDNAPWTPTDLHAATTHRIFPDVPTGSPEFKKLRSTVGKRTNFACNYGAKAGRLHNMFPRYSREFATSIYKAYAETYPGVVAYQRYCYELFATNGFGENLFGRRYYGTNGHNGGNALVQGSGAELLKEKIVELHHFLKAYKTKMQMNIHDEISFCMPKDEIFLIPILKKMMEDVKGTLVPIVAEAEITETTWAAKKGFEYDGNSIRYDD